MSEAATIQVKKEVITKLKKAREYPRQSYSELIENMTKTFIDLKERNQYDEFLHKIQQPKMNELWDNNDDGDGAVPKFGGVILTEIQFEDSEKEPDYFRISKTK